MPKSPSQSAQRKASGSHKPSAKSASASSSSARSSPRQASPKSPAAAKPAKSKAGAHAFDRPAWTDRFKTPTIDSLRNGLRAEARPLFDAIRKRLLELKGIREDIAWYGESWHWSIEYRTRLATEPLAVIIPSPQDLQLALPMDREFTRLLPLQRMKRAVREGLELVLEPYHSRWGVWSLTASSLIEELQDLVEMKLAHLAKRAG